MDLLTCASPVWRPVLFCPPRRKFHPPATRTASRRHLVVGLAGSTGDVKEIKVCVNRSCSRQGSRDILSVISDIAPLGASVASCGCLGRCGAGPNLVLLPSGVIVGHCGTPARAAELLAGVFGGGRGGGFDPWKNLEALALRKKGEAELVEKGDPACAVSTLSHAIELNPSSGLHIIYKSRSAARLAMGDSSGALEDAKEALRLSPEFPQAHICQGDVFMMMEEWDAAEKAYATALQLDPSVRRSKSFQARITKLQQRLSAVNVSP